LATLVPKKQEISEEERFEANLYKLADLALEKKAKDLKLYNVNGLTVTTDALVICTATSEPQVKAVFSAVKEGMREIGKPSIYTEGAYNDGWLIIDFGDILFHIFREQAREFYDLDGLWADAPEFKLDLKP
jgi:ribosome-associated protein